MEKIKIGISIGDINGIGLEVILKTLEDDRILNLCTPVIYGSSKVVAYHRNITKTQGFDFNNIRNAEQIVAGQVNVMNCWSENVNIKLGQLNDTGGKYAFNSLKEATNALKTGEIDALVTAPINKKAMQMVGFAFPGHTEYLTKAFDTKESLMLMVNDTLRVGLVTNHLALKDVCAAITHERIVEKIKIMNETLKIDFGIARPKIAVLALNPHASDDGLIGDEEEHIIIPAVRQAKAEGVLAIGPYPADGFFGSSTYKEYDGILAMYHDQGLVAFKALSFGSGVNYTAGLPIVRTSPDHGTAYNIAGLNQADPSSFRRALYVAIDVVRNRQTYLNMHENALQRQDERKLQQQLKEEEAKIREEEKKNRYGHRNNSRSKRNNKDGQSNQKPNTQQRSKDRPKQPQGQKQRPPVEDRKPKQPQGQKQRPPVEDRKPKQPQGQKQRPPVEDRKPKQPQGQKQRPPVEDRKPKQPQGQKQHPPVEDRKPKQPQGQKQHPPVEDRKPKQPQGQKQRPPVEDRKPKQPQGQKQRPPVEKAKVEQPIKEMKIEKPIDKIVTNQDENNA